MNHAMILYTEKPLVSIICNTYNHVDYISQAIEGFLMQKTSFCFEVLIHDDASTDGTQEIIAEYAEKYPQVIKPLFETENQYSKGKKFAREKQYARAQGKYLAYCEGDDYWIDENKLQTQVDFLESHEKYIGCVTKYIVVDENNNKVESKTFGYYDQEGEYTFEDLFHQELPSQLASYVIKNVMMQMPISFDKVPIQGDIKLNLFLLTCGSIYRLPNTMSAYRFVYEDDGKSWSSVQKNAILGYKNWRALRQLERTYKKEYDKKIRFKDRKLKAGIRGLVELKNKFSIKLLLQTILMCIIQPTILYRGVVLFIQIFRGTVNDKYKGYI